jgi:serine/threonine-protein kinase RsbW
MPAVVFSIASTTDAVRWACRAVRGILEGVLMSDDDRFSVELAVSEAATNSMRHAYGGRTDQAIEVRVSVEEKRLVVEIWDAGSPFDPKRLENASLPPESASAGAGPDPGGRGLFLIRQTMDVVRAERRDGRNILTMTKAHGGLK